MPTGPQPELDLPAGTSLQLSRPDHPDLPCRVLRSLSQGTFSRTFLARSGAGELVVLKTPRWAAASRFDADLQVEAGILPQLDHPNVVRYLGQGLEPGQGLRVLGYERGFPHPLLTISRPEVREHFEQDAGSRYVPLPLRTALELGLDLLRGIEHLHAEGFVHHDIKLANVLVRLPIAEESPLLSAQLEHVLAGRAQLFLIDIGGSRAKAYLTDLNQGRLEGDVEVVPPQVTPKYAPPEAVLPRDDDERRSLLLPSMDLYAAAVLIYATITGREPYDHLGLSLRGFPALRAAKRSEARGELQPLSHEALAGAAGAQRFSDELYVFLSTCMHPDPAERPTAPEARACLAELAAAFSGGERRQASADQPFFGVSQRRTPGA